jgi:hypothetical protein
VSLCDTLIDTPVLNKCVPKNGGEEDGCGNLYTWIDASSVD